MQFKLLPIILAAIVGPVTAQNTGSNPPAIDFTPNQGQWSPQFTIAGFTRPDGAAPVVYDFARGRDGEVVATGMFRWAGTRRAGPVARLEGEEWRSVRDAWPREGEVAFSAIAINNEGVTALSTYGGPFGSVPVEIWLDTGEEVRVIGNLQGAVRSLAWFDGKLWAAGFFQMGQGGVNNLAVWDGNTWSAPPGGPADRAVYRLVSGNSLLLAGDFTTVGGIPARGIAEWDGNTWKAYDLSPPVAAAHVYAVARGQSGELYAGGAVTGGVLRWNGTGWEQLGGGVFQRDTNGVISDLTTHQGELYVTGCFTSLNGPESDPSAIRAQSVAKWSGSQWESLDDGSDLLTHGWFEWGVCGDEPNQFTIWDVRYQRLFSDGERVFLGGMMPGVAGVPSQSIVSYDGNEWRGYGETQDGLFGASQTVIAGGPGRNVYMTGFVSHAGQAQSRASVYRYQNGWEAVAPPWPQGLICNRIAVDPWGRLFAGCYESNQSGENQQPIVLGLNGGEWAPLGVLELPGQIWDMGVDHWGRLWVVGGVRLGPAEGSGFVARWDGDQFTIVEDRFNSMVFQIDFAPEEAGSPGDVMVAGAFTRIGAESFERIAQWRGGRWEPLGAGLGSAVLALAWGRDGVYISMEAPSSTEEPDTPWFLLWHWDGSQWVELATPENGLPAPRENTVHQFRDLLAVGRYVVAAGSVWPETGGRNVFVYDGQRLAPLGGGLNAIGVSSIALANDGLWFAGEIAEAGSGDQVIPSVGIARFTAPVESEP